MQSHDQTFVQFEKMSHHNYLRSFTVQIFPLPDCSVNEHPYQKKLQVHDLAKPTNAKHSSPFMVITAFKSVDTNSILMMQSMCFQSK